MDFAFKVRLSADGEDDVVFTDISISIYRSIDASLKGIGFSSHHYAEGSQIFVFLFRVCLQGSILVQDLAFLAVPESEDTRVKNTSYATPCSSGQVAISSFSSYSFHGSRKLISGRLAGKDEGCAGYTYLFTVTQPLRLTGMVSTPDS